MRVWIRVWMRSNRIVLARTVQAKAGAAFQIHPSVFISTPAIILTAKQTALAQDIIYVGLLAVLCPLDAKPSRHAIHKPVSNRGASILNASEPSRRVFRYDSSTAHGC